MIISLIIRLIITFLPQSVCYVIIYGFFFFLLFWNKNLISSWDCSLTILKYTVLSPRNNYGRCIVSFIFSVVWDALQNTNNFLHLYWPQFYQKKFIIGGTCNWSLSCVRVTSLRLITQYLTLAFDPHTRTHLKGFWPY